MGNFWLPAIFNLGVAIGVSIFGDYLKTSSNTVIVVIGWILFLAGLIYNGREDSFGN
ncbi:MAG: hypothetical protein IPK76_14110 [Lewinellaceae bacterium]|nr:hypothetical protein [Lewinellaceae bacterium]